MKFGLKDVVATLFRDLQVQSVPWLRVHLPGLLKKEPQFRRQRKSRIIMYEIVGCNRMSLDSKKRCMLMYRIRLPGSEAVL